MEELEQIGKQMRMNAELLDGLCQDKLTQLYQDKRKARKAYQEEHSKIAAQFNNVSVEGGLNIFCVVPLGQALRIVQLDLDDLYVLNGRSLELFR